ncbi:terpene cyclase/mutase family protein [Planctomycetota bacterium]|nr:terpene cyclase/mutase family protein [Planctomycetota bacterium]
MGRDDYDSEEEYYDDDELGDEDDIDLPNQEQQRNKIIAIFSTAYGISIIVHAAILVILAFIVIAVNIEEEKAVVIAKREIKPPEYDEKLKRDVQKTPEIQAEEEVEKPIIILEEEVEVTQDVPKGTDMSNLSNKNLDSTSANDAYGVGGGAAGAYGQRWGKGSLAREGGSEGTESAVTAALRWLKFHQSPDGRWDGDGWQANCTKGRCAGPGANNGDARYDIGLTSMALLAFLGNGHTHRFGHFKVTVNRGLQWLKRQQQADGSVGYDAGHGESIYNHSIATMALCEAYAVSRDFTLKRYAEKAVRFCIESQNPALGWKYGVKSGRNDTSSTGWMVLALKAGKTAGLDVPDEAFIGARNWFERATDSNGNVGYETPGGGSSYLGPNDGKYDPVPCMTAVSVICRIFTGERRSEDAIRKGARVMSESMPSWTDVNNFRKVNYYYWYYGTYAMFQVGGDKWSQWNDAMQESLLPRQRMGGCEDGSWDPVGEWCLAGGRVYATAINALTLEIYYRYERAQSH